jgi:hypothetical protein
MMRILSIATAAGLLTAATILVNYPACRWGYGSPAVDGMRRRSV